jgi:hypothetical protein
MQAEFKYVIQSLNKAVAVFLIHSKTGCMIFLKRVIFQINQDKEQAFFHCGKRTVLVYGKTSPVIAKLAAHIVLCEILIMSIQKVRKQFLELLHGETSQGAETLFVIVIISIFHSAKVRART